MGNLATPADVELRLGRTLNPTERPRVDGLLPEASALLVGWLGLDPGTPGPVPEAVVIVCSRMVARVITQPVEAQGADSTSYTAGPYAHSMSYTPGSTTGGPWLAHADKTILAPLRRSSVAAIRLGTSHTGRYRTAV